MPSRRNQIRMDDSEIWKFIESRKSLQVATLNKDGSPHLTIQRGRIRARPMP